MNLAQGADSVMFYQVKLKQACSATWAKVGRKIPPRYGIYRYFPAWQIRLKWQILANITFLPQNTGKYDFQL